MSLALEQFDQEAFRKRLEKMTDSETDSELIRFGKSAKEMCKAGFGQAPPETFVIQLEECRAE